MDGKVILVTGGTGSWGKELVRQLLGKYAPREVRIYSRGEHEQYYLKQALRDERLRFIIGDVRDERVLEVAMRGVQVVFHLAALKHIPICEENPWEAVLTNICGTQNVVEAAVRNGVERVVDISTDKAVEPLNMYGITKACAERLVTRANWYYRFSETRFVTIRGGNVVATAGSVIPLFAAQLRAWNRITLTDGTMTRFLMNTKEAIGLVFQAVEVAQGGEIFVMRMPATSMATLAEVMVRLFGNAATEVQVIGMRPGEKRHEVLVSRNEIPFTKAFDERYLVILPPAADGGGYARYAALPLVDLPEFSSVTARQLGPAELEAVLKQEEWLFTEAAQPLTVAARPGP